MKMFSGHCSTEGEIGPSGTKIDDDALGATAIRCEKRCPVPAMSGASPRSLPSLSEAAIVFFERCSKIITL
jgi:hypothetical protein